MFVIIPAAGLGVLDMLSGLNNTSMHKELLKQHVLLTLRCAVNQPHVTQQSLTRPFSEENVTNELACTESCHESN